MYRSIDMTTGSGSTKPRRPRLSPRRRAFKDKPVALVGLTGLQKAVAQLFGRGVHFVDTVEQAKEWLVKEDDKPHKS